MNVLDFIQAHPLMISLGLLIIIGIGVLYTMSKG